MQSPLFNLTYSISPIQSHLFNRQLFVGVLRSFGLPPRTTENIPKTFPPRKQKMHDSAKYFTSREKRDSLHVEGKGRYDDFLLF
jgi:hypothetical protein